MLDSSRDLEPIRVKKFINRFHLVLLNTKISFPNFLKNRTKQGLTQKSEPIQRRNLSKGVGQLTLCPTVTGPDGLSELQSGFPNPTGPVKPPPSGSGLPDRFDRKPVEFKSKFKIACTTGSDRYTDRFTGREDRFTGRYD